MDRTIAKTNPLGTERVGKLILTFAVPSIISMVVNALYNIVDQIFIGQGVGYLGNGATNVVMPMTVIAIALSLLIGDGAAAYLSLKQGEGDEKSAANGIGCSIILWRTVEIRCGNPADHHRHHHEGKSDRLRGPAGTGNGRAAHLGL